MLANGSDWSSLSRTTFHGCGPNGRRGCSFMMCTPSDGLPLPRFQHALYLALPDDRLAVRRDVAAYAVAGLGVTAEDVELRAVELRPLRHSEAFFLRFQRVLGLGHVHLVAAGGAIRNDMSNRAAVRCGIVLDEPQANQIARPAG